MVEEILASKQAGLPLPSVVADRVGRLTPGFRAKFERVGLLEPLEPQESRQETLASFLDAYMAFRTELKPSTLELLHQAKKSLVAYFGEDVPLDAITPGDADEFRNWLRTKRKRPLAENTARRLCARGKQFFQHAVRKRLISENPFAHMRGLIVRGNAHRQRFVDREVIDRVLSGCANADWRLLVALCRYGGVRPSEACNLRWEHVDWDRRVLRIHCGKTQHHAGREWREVPIFPEIASLLQDSWEAAEPGEVMVLRDLRSTRNLRKPFQDLLRRIGVEPWPKPFQNLRSTRETELAHTFPEHVVCAWLGNTGRVAREHYLQVTEADVRRAVAGPAGEPTSAPRGGRSFSSPGSEGNHKSNHKCNHAWASTDGPERHGVPAALEGTTKNPGPGASFLCVPGGAASPDPKPNCPTRIRT